MTTLTEIQCYFTIIVISVSTLITVSNLKFLKSLSNSLARSFKECPNVSISILVPARNEESNIGQCLEALTQQDYAFLEILVLDDHSSDKTPTIIKNLAKSDSRIRMIQGAELPDGWVGKNWACHQLHQEATGDFLLFIDADTILSEGTVVNSLSESIECSVDLLTVMPRRTANCIAERLLFPFIDWAVFSWMPMKAAHESNIPQLSTTFGQFMLFKREAYNTIGGHAAIHGNPFDDFELGHMVKKKNLKWMLLSGENSVKVLPYKDSIEAFKGVSRSVFPALDYHSSVLGMLSLFLLALAFLPPATLIAGIMFFPLGSAFIYISIASIALLAMTWLIVCRKFKHNILAVPLYPLSIALIVAVAAHSLITYGLRVTKWKERKLIGQEIRL